MLANELDSESGIEEGCDIGVCVGEDGRKGLGEGVWISFSIGVGDCTGVKVREGIGVGVVDGFILGGGVDVGGGIWVGDIVDEVV